MVSGAGGAVTRRRRDLRFWFLLFSFLSVNLPQNPNLSSGGFIYSDRHLCNGAREQWFLIFLNQTSPTNLSLKLISEETISNGDIATRKTPATLPHPLRTGSIPQSVKEKPLFFNQATNVNPSLTENQATNASDSPSSSVPPPVKSGMAHQKTLIWLVVSFSGLGPRYQEQLLGPTPLSLKILSKGCGPLKPIHMIKMEAHLPSIQVSRFFKPRYAYFHHRTSLISLMFQHPVLVGRRLLPSRVATSLSLVGLMDPFEGLNFLKNFDNAQSLEVDWKKAQVDSKKILAQPHQSTTSNPSRQGAHPEFNSTSDREVKTMSSFVQNTREPIICADYIVLFLGFDIKEEGSNIRAINMEEPPKELQGLFDDIQWILNLLSSISISFAYVSRKENSIADVLASTAVRSMTIGSFVFTSNGVYVY